jgi:hypothetical protein
MVRIDGHARLASANQYENAVRRQIAVCVGGIDDYHVVPNRTWFGKCRNEGLIRKNKLRVILGASALLALEACASVDAPEYYDGPIG